MSVRYEIIYSNNHDIDPCIIVYYDEIEIHKRNIIGIMTELFKSMIS